MQDCTRCGQQNRHDARFCNACGAPLGAEAPAGVRKTVTVVFCDLVGSTSLGDGGDPELLRELMARYHAELRAILERHGGTVEKFVGDAAMAVFGVPQAHEDDALRAVRAAHEMRAAVARLGLEVRIGVNTGVVVAGGGETLITGDAVNVAARLEQAAVAGEILLGDGTHLLVREAVRADLAPPLQLKGKADPVRAHRLLDLLPDVPAFTRAIETPFVGRTEELERLANVMGRAIGESRAQLATIVGPPGIGKSRLVRELAQRTDARVLIGRCVSYGEGITYWPLKEIVSQVGDLESALAGDADAGLVASRLAAAVDVGGGEASSEEIAWGFRRLFEALARDRSLIVVLDDIHWAEPTLLDLIEYVASFAHDAPLLLLCAARPELLDVRPTWASPRRDSIVVNLGSLAEGEVARLVDEQRSVPPEIKTRIVEAAEGNPLFVEQLLAMRSDTDDNALEIPPTIQALLAARIDALTPDERAVIERASVEGRMFHRGAVAELLPERWRPRVGTHLVALVRKEFVRPDRSIVPGDDGFCFGHILICDAAYDTIPKRLRAQLHERFAEWLGAKLADEAPGEVLAYHLERAYRYRVEFSADDAHALELAFRAGRLLADAAWRADARLDVGATRSLAERAVALLPKEDPELPALLELLGSALSHSGDFRSALEVERRAQSAAAAAGQRSVELRARMQELSDLLIVEPERDTNLLLAEAMAAIDELADLDEAESLAEAWQLVTDVAAMRSDFALLAMASTRRLEIARQAGLRTAGVWASAWLTLALAEGETPVEEAIVRAERVLAEFPSAQSGEFHLALLYAFAGRDQDAEETIERSRRALLELGQHALHASMSMNAGWIALLAGKPGRAEQDLRASASVLEELGDTGVLSTVAAVLAEVLYRLERDDEALEWTRTSEQTTSAEDVFSHARWRATRAVVLARRGEAENAIRFAAEAVDWARRSDSLPLLGDALFARGDALRVLGRVGDAQLVLEEALAVYERKGIVPSIQRTRLLLQGVTQSDVSQ